MSQSERPDDAHLVDLKQQQALMESFHRGRGIANAIIEASPVPKMLLNAQGEVMYLNRAFTRAFGYELDDIPTLEIWWRKAYPNVQERRAGWWMSMMDQFLTGQAEPVPEMRELTCKDGRRRQVEKNAARIALDAGEPSLLLVYHDVTELTEAHQTLQRQHEYLEAILASEPECVKVVSREGELQQMNPAGLAMLEVRDLAEARAHGLINFIDPPFRQAFLALHRRVCAGQVAQLEFSITGAKGTKRWMETHATPLHDPDGGIRLLSVTRDITARKATEDELADRNHYLWLNNRVLQMLGENAAMKDVLAEMVRIIEENQPGNLMSVLLVDPDGQHLVHGAAPSLPQGWIDLISRVPIGDGQGSCGTAAFRGERVIVDDIATHPFWSDYRDQALAHELRSCWSHPIKDGHGRVLGTFAIYRHQATHPTAHDLDLLEDYAKLARLVIERSKMAEALQESQRLYRLIAENSNDVIWVMELPGETFSYVSPSVRRLRGWNNEEVLHNSLDTVMSPSMQKRMNEKLQEHIQRLSKGDLTARSVTLELELLHKDGHAVPVEVVGNIMLDAQGRPVQVVGSSRDITERKQAEEAIREMAFYDRLTGLPNRRLLEERMRQLIALAEREQRKMAVLFLDLDKFKQVNDLHGHEAGDWLLQRVADRMRSVLRQSDTAARVGGDEFVILLPDADTVEAAVSVAEKIRHQMELPFVMDDGVALDISSSIGVVMYPDQADNGRDLLRYGDEAMYRAKKRGRNAVEVFVQASDVQ